MNPSASRSPWPTDKGRLCRLRSFARRARTAARRYFARDIVVANRRPVLQSEPWTIDRLSVSGDRVTVTGWAFPPRGWMNDEAPRFEVNGARAEKMTRLLRADVA